MKWRRRWGSHHWILHHQGQRWSGSSGRLCGRWEWIPVSCWVNWADCPAWTDFPIWTISGRKCPPVSSVPRATRQLVPYTDLALHRLLNWLLNGNPPVQLRLLPLDARNFLAPPPLGVLFGAPFWPRLDQLAWALPKLRPSEPSPQLELPPKATYWCPLLQPVAQALPPLVVRSPRCKASTWTEEVVPSEPFPPRPSHWPPPELWAQPASWAVPVAVWPAPCSMPETSASKPDFCVQVDRSVQVWTRATRVDAGKQPDWDHFKQIVMLHFCAILFLPTLPLTSPSVSLSSSQIPQLCLSSNMSYLTSSLNCPISHCQVYISLCFFSVLSVAHSSYAIINSINSSCSLANWNLESISLNNQCIIWIYQATHYEINFESLT